MVCLILFEVQCFFFKQKTAYEMRISDWSSDVCSSDLPFIYYDLIFGGYGARAYADGVEGLAPVINCANIPVEVHESGTPIKVHRSEERRVGKECVSTCRSRWSPYH